MKIFGAFFYIITERAVLIEPLFYMAVYTYIFSNTLENTYFIKNYNIYLEIINNGQVYDRKNFAGIFGRYFE